MTLPLAGCKDTDVLTQKIIGAHDQYEVDYSLAPVSLDNPRSSTYESSLYEQSSETQNDIQQDTPQYDDQQTVDDQVDQQTPNTSNSSDAASTGTVDGSSTGSAGKQGAGAAAGEEGDGAGTVFQLGDDPNSTENDNNSQVVNASESDDNKQDTWKDPSSDPNGGSKPGAIIPADSGYGNLPQAKGIAARGYIAIMVQSLCGEGGLRATDYDTFAALPASVYDSGQEFKTAGKETTFIEGWGEGVMNESIFQQIIDSGADTYLYAANCGVLSEDWVNRFSEMGINVVALNAINEYDSLDADIVENVQVIGELMEESGCSTEGRNPKQMASEWKRVHDTLLEQTVQANGGYAVTVSEGQSYPYIYQGGSILTSTSVTTQRTRAITTYVSGFDSEPATEAELMSTNHKIYNHGFWPWSDFASISQTLFIDVSQGYPQFGMSQGTTSKSVYVTRAYYLQCAGIALANPFSGNILSPIQTTRVALTNVHQGDYSQLIYPGCSSALGGAGFPAIIAEGVDVAERVSASGSYADREARTAGFFNYGSPYRVYVMPEGVSGSWAYGTFESFLLAPWALYVYDGGSVGSTIDMSNITNLVNEFYELFYRAKAVDGGAGILDAESLDEKGTSCWGGYLVATGDRDN